MKCIIVTDTHLGIKKSNIKYLDVVKSLFEDICTLASNSNINTLVHLGDFFDNRKHLSLTALDYATEIGSMVNDTFQHSYFVLGNHDLFYKDKYFPTSHQVFNEYSNIHVVSSPSVVDNVLLVPWQLENDRHHPRVDFKDYSGIDYCMGHFDINGTKMGLNTKDASDCRFSVSDFQQFKQTLSGHFHTIGDYPNNIKFIGSPYHQTFADSGSRGFYIWEDGDLQFIEFTGYPKYLNLVVDSEDYTPDDIEGCVVKLTFNKDYGSVKNGQIVKRVNDCKPLNLFTNYQFEKDSVIMKLDDNIKLRGVKEIHVDYIDKSNVPEHLNKGMVIKMVNQLYDEYNKGE